MKYAKRMVLIPEVEYLALKQTSPSSRKHRLPPTSIQLEQESGKRIRTRDQETHVLQRMLRPKQQVSLVEHLPPTYQSKAKALLSELELAHIKPSENKELVLPSGETVYGSNVVDLVKEAV